MGLRLVKKSRGEISEGQSTISKHFGEKKSLSSSAVPALCILVAVAAQ